MKYHQLEVLARNRPHLATSKLIFGSGFAAIAAFFVGINVGDYFTPMHTNSYNLILSFFCHSMFTLGAGGLVGL